MSVLRRRPYNFLLLPLLLMLVMMTTSLKASHQHAYEMEIECVNGCSTSVTVSTYFYGVAGQGGYNACGRLAFDPVTVNCAAPVELTSVPYTLTLTEITPVCLAVPTQWTDANSPILAEIRSECTELYSFCNVATTCEYEFRFSGLIGQSQATTMENVYELIQDGMYTYFPGGCNSSPEFLNDPVLRTCAGRDAEYALAGWDADGDSLVYVLDACLKDANLTPFNYLNGASPSQPMGNSWDVSLDAQTGQIYLRAIPGLYERSYVCLGVEEYRGGNLIGRYFRDFLIMVDTNCVPNDNPVFGAMTIASGNATVNGAHVEVCGQGPICIDIPVTDPNAGQTLSLTWNQPLAGATFANANNPAQQNVVVGAAPVGRLCFTPPGPGDYALSFTAVDSVCPFMGRTQQAVFIHVNSTFRAEVQHTAVNCTEFDLSAFACGGSGNYTYQWSGAGGLTGTTATVNHTYPGQGSYAWQCIVDDGVQPPITLNGTIVVGGPQYMPLIAPAGTTYICQGQFIPLATGAGYASYLWSNGDVTAQTLVSNPGTYSVTVTDAQGCQFFDSTVVLMQPIQYQQMIVPSDTMDRCGGVSSVNLSAGSWFWYDWNTGANSASIDIREGGLYSVTVQDAQGCEFQDFYTAPEVLPSVYGRVYTSQGQPLENQPVLLIDRQFNAPLVTISALDTVLTDSTGYYYFCGFVDSTVYLKAIPDSATYPTEMPAYMVQTITPMGMLYVASGTYFNIQPAGGHHHNFATVPGQNPGGPGFIGGIITQGANRTAGPGDAVSGLNLFLYHQDLEQYIDHTQSDANGYFFFGQVPLGNYKVIADYPGVDTLNVPELSLSAVSYHLDSLDFRLHSTYLELVTAAVAAPGALEGGQVTLELSPNPTEARQSVLLDLPQASPVELVLLDAYGRQLAALADRRYAAGRHVLTWDADALGLADGVYFLRLTTEEGVVVRKAILSR